MAQAFEINPGSASAEPRPISELIGRFAPLIFLVLMMSVFAVLEPRFLDPTNLFNVMRQISITGLIALGMTFVILTAGIDLSVGSVLALAGIIAAAIAKGSAGNTLSLDPDQAAGYGWFATLSGRGRHRPSVRLYPRDRDHPPQGAAFRGDARRALDLPRVDALVLGRRPDLRFRVRISAGGDRD